MSFTLVEQKKVPFVDGTIYRYIHNRTRCEVLHVYNNDIENVYTLSLPSYPSNDKGVAHVLEHCVLSGSERYKVKSPFFRLAQGSCHTYFNAATYPDRTIYSGASLVAKDLFNLMAMSTDALLFPLLDEAVFRRESIHLQETEGTIHAGGVVYNEMKGVYSDSLTRIERAIQTLIFPDISYKFDFGGDPDAIPFLSYQEFLAFYKKFYRPEYMKILLYGNIPTNEYLNFIEESCLSRWTQNIEPKLNLIPLQQKIDIAQYDQDHNEIITLVDIPSSEYATGEEGSLDITWLLGETSDVEHVLLLRLMHFVLLGIPGAPLRKKILESGLVDDISHLSGPSNYLQQATYTIGGTGLQASDYAALRDLIFEGLQEIVTQGIPLDYQKAAVNRIEFNLKERLNSTGGKVSWLSFLASKWLYQEDLDLYIDPEYTMSLLKELSQSPTVITNFIQEYFLQNTHRIIVGAAPKAEYSNHIIKKEQQILAQAFKNKQEYWKSIETSIHIAQEHADSQEAINAIPLLHKKDLPKAIISIPQKSISVGQSMPPVTWIPHNDNGILYMQIQFDITDLMCDQHIRYLIPTFTASLTDLGVKTIKYEGLSVQICLTTGKLGAIHSNYVHTDGGVRIFLNMQVHILESKKDVAFEIIQKLLLELDFENISRLQELIKEGKSLLRARMQDSSMTFGIMKAAQNYSFNALVDDDCDGISQLQWIVGIDDVNSVSKDLQSLSEKIFSKERISFSIVAHECYKASGILEKFVALVDMLPNVSYALDSACHWDKDQFGYRVMMNVQEQKIPTQAIIFPTQIANNIMVFPAIGYKDNTYAHHKLLAHIVSEVLTEKIRMAGGAYGSGAFTSGEEKLFICYSYRDPNVKTSFEIFKTAFQDIAQGKFDTSMLDSHIVGAVGSTIVQLSPAKKLRIATSRLFSAIDDDIRQAIRDTMLATTKEDIQTAAVYYLDNITNKSVVSVCNEEMSTQMEWDTISYAPH